jgi:hypothetical protein
MGGGKWKTDKGSMGVSVAYFSEVRVHQAEVQKHQARVGEGVRRHCCEVEVGVSCLKGCR